MYSQFIRKQYFTVDSLIWSQSVTDFLQYTIIFLRWDFLAKCPAELWFLLVTLWGLISLRAFEREKLILTACAKYNVSWQNPKPSREGPSRFELNSGFQRWQAVALSHRHLVLPIAGKAKKKKTQRHLVQITNAKSTNENSTTNTDWSGILLTCCPAPL